MNLTGRSILTAEELLQYRTAKPERSLPRKGVKEYGPDDSWLHRKQIENILDEIKFVLDEERVEKVGTLSIAVWDEGLNLAIVTYITGRHWEVFGHKHGTKIALHPEEALYLLETSNLQLLHNDVALSIQQGYSTLLGTKTGCPLNYYKVYSHLVRHGFRILRHAPPPVTDYERKIGLHHYLGKKSENTPSNLNMNCQSEASNAGDIDVSNMSSDSYISSSDNMDVKDSEVQEIKSDEEVGFKTELQSDVRDKCVDDLITIEAQHHSNFPVQVESHFKDKCIENLSLFVNQTNIKVSTEAVKNDEFSSYYFETSKTSVKPVNAEKEAIENKNFSEKSNGVKYKIPDNEQLNHQKLVTEENIPEVEENMIKPANCSVSNDNAPEVFLISDSSTDSEAIDVVTIPEEHNLLSQKLKNNIELVVKQGKLHAECEIMDDYECVKSTEKKELNTSENEDIIFVNEVKKPQTIRQQKRRPKFLNDCVIDVETDTFIRNDQVMPRKKVKNNFANTTNSKNSVINCEIVDVCHDDVKADTDSSNVNFKAENSSCCEEVDVELEHQNKSNLEDWQSILRSFPNFAKSEQAVIKLPDPKFLPPNVTPSKSEYTLDFRHGNGRIRPYRHNYRHRCNETYGLDGYRNMERQSFPQRNLNPGLLGPCPEQFNILMGATRYNNYYVSNNFTSNVYNNLLFQQPFINNCPGYRFQQPQFNQNQQEFVSPCDQIMERQFSDSCAYESTVQNNFSNCRKGHRERYRPADEYTVKNPMMNRKNRPRFNSNRYFAASKKFQPQMEKNYVTEVVNREWNEFMKFSAGAKNWSEIKRKIDDKPHETMDDGIKEEHTEPDVIDEVEKEEIDIKPLLEPSDCLNIGNVLSKLQIFQEPKFQNGFLSLNSELTAQYDMYLPNKKFKKSSPSSPDFRVCVVGCDTDIPSQRDIALLYRKFQDNVPLLFAVVIPGSVAFYHFSNVRLPEDRSVPT